MRFAGIVTLLLAALGTAPGCAVEAAKDLTLDLGNGVAMRLVLVPEGTFLMGSPNDEPGRSDDEAPHQVAISDPFYMAVTPVTVDQYAQFMHETKRWHVSPPLAPTGAQPVVNVSWEDAYEFCDWLSWKTGTSAALPTEAQWEYACRGGTATPYHGGANIEALAQAGWYAGNSGGRPHAVAQKQANAWGLYDMHGNVWQWCADWYGPYPAADQTDPAGPGQGSARVLRGGAWSADPRNCRSAYRGRAAPGFVADNLGFRVVVEADRP
jgi:formylglycine-generating enzyme required for sulfatase activity